jgi:hypothetical protein
MASLEQVTNQIRDSRRILGETILKTVEPKILSQNQARALNTHLGVADPKMRLSLDNYSKLGGYLGEIVELVTTRREHLQTHRIVLPDMRRRLGESGVLALAVGAAKDTNAIKRPLARRELDREPLVARIATSRAEPTSVAIDRAVINDLHWLAAPTRPNIQ